MPVHSVTITGVDGFVGKHLAREAKDRGLRVVGVSRSRELATDLHEVVDEFVQADLTAEFPAGALSDVVFHLAGLAAVGQSFHEPQSYISTNSSMITNLCEAMLRQQGTNQTRVVAVSTGAVYRSAPIPMPLTEASATWVPSPYVLSKLLIEQQFEYYRSLGISAIVARPFNHIGPNQGLGFLIPDLWERLRSTDSGVPLAVGNLATRRDYTDVRDVVRAYVDLALQEELKYPVYNVCSGRSVSGQELLTELCEVAQIDVPVLKTNLDLVRPNDAGEIVGSHRRLTDETGWIPEITVRESIEDFLRDFDEVNR